jgi:biotin transporter BioY
VVLLYSAKANESPQIKREVERSVNRGLPLIPFRIDNVPMSKSLEYFISTPHWLDALSGPMQQHLDRLADTVALILGGGGAAAAATAADTSPIASPLAPRVRNSATDMVQGASARALMPGTLARALAPRANRMLDLALIAVGVLGIALLAQIEVGPIWLQPLAVLLVAAVLGSVRGGIAALIYVALGFTGLPVYGGGDSAWSELGNRAPYAVHAVGYLVGIVAAAFIVGWLAEHRSWDQRMPTAALLGLVGVALLYLPGRIWIETITPILREARPQISLLPSIAMLVITIGIMAVSLPLVWSSVTHQQSGRLKPEALQTEPNA